MFLLVPALSQRKLGRLVGKLIDTDHDVSGKVYRGKSLNDDILVIKDFSFDNTGFGVYISVATKGKSLADWKRNRISVPYPTGSEGEPIEKLYNGKGPPLKINLKQVMTQFYSCVHLLSRWIKGS